MTEETLSGTVLSLEFRRFAGILVEVLSRKTRTFLGIGLGTATIPAGRAARAGLFSSGFFLALVGFAMIWVSGSLEVPFLILIGAGFGLSTLSLRNDLTLSRANTLALTGQMIALFSFYIFYTRVANVTYVTDSIVGTYMGVVKVLHLENPYVSSIKPFLDQLGFPPSLYTPRADGSFEFHLNYPALNFLSIVPLYLAGLHDLRDGVLVFHIASILLIFGLVPARLKALSLAPFAFGFPLAIGYSWTDSVWAFFVLLTAILWYRNKGLSLASFGLAVATKQIVLVAAPFLLVRVWKESEGSKLRGLLKGSALILAAFLVPNIAFIIASPSSWWGATVGPYLPGGSSMVPGGIGLSEILPDLGLVLSANFYIIATGAVAVACLAAFVRGYERLNCYVWAMPIFILFFYYRSLPNYLVFWVLPFIFEWFRYGHPSLSYLRGVFHPAWSRTSRDLVRSFRMRVGPSVLLVLILTTALVGVSGAYVARVSGPRVEVKVDRIADPDSLGVATMLGVTVTNPGSRAISPIFFVKWFFLWDLWKTNETQSLIGGGVSYVLTATDALGGVPRGSSFHVAVYDSATGQLVAQSPSYTADIARPPVANPQFTWWTLDSATGRQVPFGWKLSLVNIDPRAGGIRMLDQNFSRGVELRMNSTVNLVTPGQLVLSQRLLFNETDLNVLVRQPAQITTPSEVVLGARVTDGAHTLYFVFSGTASTTTIITYASNATVTIPLVYDAWDRVTLDTQSVWTGQGWGAPTSLELALFLRSGTDGLFLASIRQVVQTSP